ncbi:WXG100 family type VII secretion target [Actinoplanes sp. NPDC049265]|uniref:WXG100 family type VII secretion target n=1 Tax=Actinoplanes sp. NPDC049265 TaxID=3363902 RepID=UPI00371BA599
MTSGVAQTEAQSQQMADTANKFESTNSSIQSMLSTLMGQLSELQAGWKGLAAGEFEKVKQQYDADLKTLSKALTDTATSIRESATSYDTTDTEAASSVSKTGSTGYTLPL